MNPYAEHADGMRELQTELGGDCPSFVWYLNKTTSSTVKALPGSLLLKSSNSAGGLQLDSDFQCTCLRADFSELPNTNQRILYAGKMLSIDSVFVMPGGYQLRIKANDAAQGL
jgi:hypothetical protein